MYAYRTTRLTKKKNINNYSYRKKNCYRFKFILYYWKINEKRYKILLSLFIVNENIYRKFLLSI